jgi:hypothetical protein
MSVSSVTTDSTQRDARPRPVHERAPVRGAAVSTEPAMVEGTETQIGRDPRRMTEAELNAIGHFKRPILRAIRQNCVECCAGAEAEVRRCRMITCPMWPYRMASNPFREKLGDEQREAARARLSGNRPVAAAGSLKNSDEELEE